MTDEDHLRLINILNNIEGKYILSGYPSELYDENLKYAYKKEFETICSAAGKTSKTGLKGNGNIKEKQKRIEVIWANFLKNEGR